MEAFCKCLTGDGMVERCWEKVYWKEMLGITSVAWTLDAVNVRITDHLVHTNIIDQRKIMCQCLQWIIKCIGDWYR